MARLSDDTRAKILADWKAGISQNKLAKKYSVSPATINKICKGIEKENECLVNSQVAINRALTDKSEYEVNSIHSLVHERTKHLIYFQDSALESQRIGNELLSRVSEMKDVLAHSTLTAKNKETVCGKDIPLEELNADNIIEVELE